MLLPAAGTGLVTWAFRATSRQGTDSHRTAVLHLASDVCQSHACTAHVPAQWAAAPPETAAARGSESGRPACYNSCRNEFGIGMDSVARRRRESLESSPRPLSVATQAHLLRMRSQGRRFDLCDYGKQAQSPQLQAAQLRPSSPVILACTRRPGRGPALQTAPGLAQRPPCRSPCPAKQLAWWPAWGPCLTNVGGC